MKPSWWLLDLAFVLALGALAWWHFVSGYVALNGIGAILAARLMVPGQHTENPPKQAHPGVEIAALVVALLLGAKKTIAPEAVVSFGLLVLGVRLNPQGTRDAVGIKTLATSWLPRQSSSTHSRENRDKP